MKDHNHPASRRFGPRYKDEIQTRSGSGWSLFYAPKYKGSPNWRAFTYLSESALPWYSDLKGCVCNTSYEVKPPRRVLLL